MRQRKHRLLRLPVRLPVRQQERTVDEKCLAVDLTAPRALIARNCAAPTLVLDQVDLVDRDDEQIDFVDRDVSLVPAFVCGGDVRVGV